MDGIRNKKSTSNRSMSGSFGGRIVNVTIFFQSLKTCETWERVFLEDQEDCKHSEIHACLKSWKV